MISQFSNLTLEDSFLFLSINKFLMANSADPDHLASEEANRSGSTLFAKAGYIQIQQDKINIFLFLHRNLWSRYKASGKCRYSARRII